MRLGERNFISKDSVVTKAHILIVEDNGIVALDLETRLQSLGYGVAGIVASGEKAVESVKEKAPDLVLMDIVLKGEMDGIEAAETIGPQFEVPVIFITAYADRERLERAKLTMPFGYILKPFRDRDLKITIEMALYVAKVEAERRQAEESLREHQKLITLALEGTDEGIWDWDVIEGNISFNDDWIRILGYEPGERTFDFDWWIRSVHPDSRPVFESALNEYLEGLNKYYELEYRIRTNSGEWKWVWVRGICIEYDPDGSPRRFIGTHRDITDLKHTKKVLEKTEKKYQLFFEASPISQWDGDFSEVKKYMESLRDSGVEDFRAYFENHPEAVAHCCDIVKIVDVNQATLNMYKAPNKESLLNNLGFYLQQRPMMFSKRSLSPLRKVKRRSQAMR